MRMIRHPYIVKLVEVMSTQQKIILVMEYVKGGDLFAKITSQSDERLSEEESRLYFQQIIMALEYCHELKIIHRDLKPENILIDKATNSIKISDFGLSTLLKYDQEMIKNAAGTPDYLAPEVIKQTEGYLGHPADIWGAGVILYNMATGANPFHNEDPAIKLKNIQTGTVEYPKYLSKALIDLLSKIIVPHPKNRYTINQIKEHPWFKINFKPVIGYLQEKKHEIKYLDDYDETKGKSPKKEKKEIRSKNFNIFIDTVPM
jgi:serine/threonine protein kinase